LATDQILADENALNEVLWPLTDHLGTTRDLATYDSVNGTDIDTHRVFDSFGNVVPGGFGSATLLFGFTGRLFDEATQLQYNLNRWYDAATGRWISEDPIGFAGGDTNLNRYVGNAPTFNVDPDGLRAFTMEVVYYFKEINMNANVQKEVDRIFQDLMNRFSAKDKNGKFCNTLKLSWKDAKSKDNYNKTRFGLSDRENFGFGYPKKVTLGIEDTYSGVGEGQGFNYEGNLKGSVLVNDIAVATAIAHELGFHGITGYADHFHDFGYTDAKLGGQKGKTFSDEAGKLIAKALGLDKC